MSVSIGSEILSVKSPHFVSTIAAIPHLFLMCSYISPLSDSSFKAAATLKNSALRFLFCATIPRVFNELAYVYCRFCTSRIWETKKANLWKKKEELVIYSVFCFVFLKCLVSLFNKVTLTSCCFYLFIYVCLFKDSAVHKFGVTVSALNSILNTAVESWPWMHRSHECTEIKSVFNKTISKCLTNSDWENSKCAKFSRNSLIVLCFQKALNMKHNRLSAIYWYRSHQCD